MGKQKTERKILFYARKRGRGEVETSQRWKSTAGFRVYWV